MKRKKVKKIKLDGFKLRTGIMLNKFGKNFRVGKKSKIFGI
jgi:hypothetical protein